MKTTFDFKIFRKFFKYRMMRTALAKRIIHFIKTYRNIIILSSYFAFVAVILSSYWQINGIVPSSYLPVVLLLAKFSNQVNPFGKDFWVEELGGDGSRVVDYIRVSTGRQAKKGMSLEVQKEILDKMKEEFKPSRIYWVVDPGMSGEDFDRRKIGKILELREKRMVDELWVTHIDRIGRDCRKSLLFFLQFSEDGGVIRTPERAYTTKDLVDILVYTIESYGAQSENRRRAERANASKLQNFRSKKWNKPIPLGYCRDGNWIRKAEGYEPIVKDIFDMFIWFKSINALTKFIQGKYGRMLSKPLTRDKVKRILANPVYVGRPSFGGAMVVDEQLRYIDDETYKKCQDLLETEKTATEQKKPSTLAQLALCYDLSLLDFIDEIAELHHRGCGGILAKNGPRFQGLIMQQAYKCSTCGAQFRIPTRSMLYKSENSKK